MRTVELRAEGIDLPTWGPRCKLFVGKVLEALSAQSVEISIILCSNEFIKDLNKRYRGKDEPTDVLSFPQSEGDHFGSPDGPTQGEQAGDVVISLQSAEENARYFGVELEEELKRLIIHGILHLLGWDHRDNSPDQEMLKLQEQILTDLMGERLL